MYMTSMCCAAASLLLCLHPLLAYMVRADMTEALHIGHRARAATIGSAHSSQQHRCPQGWKMTQGAADQQTVQSSSVSSSLPSPAGAVIAALLCARLLLREDALLDLKLAGTLGRSASSGFWSGEVSELVTALVS